MMQSWKIIRNRWESPKKSHAKVTRKLRESHTKTYMKSHEKVMRKAIYSYENVLRMS